MPRCAARAQSHEFSARERAALARNVRMVPGAYEIVEGTRAV